MSMCRRLVIASSNAFFALYSRPSCPCPFTQARLRAITGETYCHSKFLALCQRLSNTRVRGLSSSLTCQELGNLWQLPNEIAESIVHHHAPSSAYRHKYLASLVYLADVAVRKMGIGESGNYTDPEVGDAYAQKLHVALEDIVSQREDLLRQVEAIVSPDGG